MKKCYTINECATVEFDPTDRDFSERLFRAEKLLNQKYKQFLKCMEKLPRGKRVYELSVKVNKEMRGIIDELFAAPVCAAVFEQTPLTAISNGQPVWCNFMTAIMDTVRESQNS